MSVQAIDVHPSGHRNWRSSVDYQLSLLMGLITYSYATSRGAVCITQFFSLYIVILDERDCFAADRCEWTFGQSFGLFSAWLHK